MKKVILLSSLLLCFSSCEKTDEFADVISISTVPTLAALVPTSRQNCTDIQEGIDSESVAASSLAWRSFSVQWKDTARDLYIIKIKLDMSETLVGSSVEIADPEELNFMFGITGGKIPRSGTTGAPTGNIYKSDSTSKGSISPCFLTFGGFAPAEGISATVNGTLKLTGIAVDDFGNEQVVRSSTEVQVLVDTK